MYYPEKTYCLTEVSLNNLNDIQKYNSFLVGIAEHWDEEKRAIIVNLGKDFVGIIPEQELTLEDLKYRNNDKSNMPVQANSVLNKKICAKITKINGNKVFLSRKELQIEAMRWLNINQTYNVVIKAVCSYGVYVDVAVGLTAFIHISEISTTRFKSLKDANMVPGETIRAVVLSIDKKICMSYRRAFKLPLVEIGDYINGIVRSELEDGSGYFVEISPNECGIVDSKTKLGNKIYISYGTHIKCKVVGMRIISDDNGNTKIQYKLRLTS